MMNEKRFKGYAEKTGQHYMLIINDELGEEYCLTDDFFKSKEIIFEIVDLLNVMNETLLKQAKENHKLSNENVEQQSTIRRLQDLCGESDSENAKLRLKSKELQEEIKLLKPTNIEQYEQIQKLQKENEQLLRCKYFVKAVEVFTDCPISETIADYSDGELFDEEEQLEFGKKMLEQEKELVEDE
jgi:predicted RNase H-like nuclease (RuvC/YqgF family)